MICNKQFYHNFLSTGTRVYSNLDIAGCQVTGKILLWILSINFTVIGDRSISHMMSF